MFDAILGTLIARSIATTLGLLLAVWILVSLWHLVKWRLRIRYLRAQGLVSALC